MNPSYQTICAVYQHLQNQADSEFEVLETLDQIKMGADIKNGMAVGSALTALMRHGLVERFDVAGSRAKGTRLLKPDILTSKIGIDRAALEEKERRDSSKLSAMVELCYARVCRQQWIMEYFGEANAAPCGSCDFCRSKFGNDLAEGTDAQVLIMRKALSGVARMSRKIGGKWEGRFGRGRIVQMLVGSKSQEVKKNKLDTLSTYGLLKSEGTAYLNELFHALHDAGLIYTQKGEYPLVSLTPRGELVMLGKMTSPLVWPGQSSNSADDDDVIELEEVGFDPNLYERLKQVRHDFAKAENVPAYAIFPNKTLEMMTRLRPKSMKAGRTIKGIGEAKADRYLAQFIAVITTYG